MPALPATTHPAWIGSDVLVNSMVPGVIDTPTMTASLASQQDLENLKAMLPCPIGRFGKAGELAAALTWLLSPANGMMVGQQIFVDNGSNAVLRLENI